MMRVKKHEGIILQEITHSSQRHLRTNMTVEPSCLHACLRRVLLGCAPTKASCSPNILAWWPYRIHGIVSIHAGRVMNEVHTAHVVHGFHKVREVHKAHGM